MEAVRTGRDRTWDSVSCRCEGDLVMKLVDLVRTMPLKLFSAREMSAALCASASFLRGVAVQDCDCMSQLLLSVFCRATGGSKREWWSIPCGGPRATLRGVESPLTDAPLIEDRAEERLLSGSLRVLLALCRRERRSSADAASAAACAVATGTPADRSKRGIVASCGECVLSDIACGVVWRGGRGEGRGGESGVVQTPLAGRC